MDILNAHAHPAYPSAATLDIETRAERIANKAWQNNQRVREILSLCRDKLEATCDLSGYSMIDGMDLRDILHVIDDCMPDIHSDIQSAALDAWAMEQAGEV